jgi:hypothetical protein
MPEYMRKRDGKRRCSEGDVANQQSKRDLFPVLKSQKAINLEALDHSRRHDGEPNTYFDLAKVRDLLKRSLCFV